MVDEKIICVLNDVFDNFDFKKVKAVMDNLDWKWCGMKRADIQTGELKVKSDVPTLDEIKKAAADILWDCACGNDEVVAGGGFRAEKDFSDPEDPWMRLSFEIEDWDALYSDIESEEDYLE